MHFRQINQRSFLRNLTGNAQISQRIAHARQAIALSSEHHDVLALQPVCNLRRHPARRHLAFHIGCMLFRVIAWRIKRIAPDQFTAGLLALGRWCQRQPDYAALLRALSRVTAKFIRQFSGRFRHHRVNHLHHALRIAPRVVAREQRALQAIAHKARSRFKHLRLGAAKAINTLLGIAHDEHARAISTLSATARAHIAREPGLQRLPLQRIRVLKLINQQMAQLRIQALLHPA